MQMKRAQVGVIFTHTNGTGWALGDVPVDAEHDDIVEVLEREITRESKGKYTNVKVEDYNVNGYFDDGK
jgi:hypothetical protein